MCTSVQRNRSDMPSWKGSSDPKPIAIPPRLLGGGFGGKTSPAFSGVKKTINLLVLIVLLNLMMSYSL
jgi:hypothetical protein